MKLMVKRCNKCGALIHVLNDCNCDDCKIVCCGEGMEILKPNSVDAAFEKHVPEVEKDDDKIKVKVNHVMEEEHYIEWICYVTDNGTQFTYFKPGDTPEATYRYEANSIVYAYCNKHELWSSEVK